jgi:rubredoxin
MMDYQAEAEEGAPDCKKIEGLLSMAPGEAFQDRDAWRKAAYAFERKFVAAQAELAQLRAEVAKLKPEADLADLYRRHELMPNTEAECSCPSCNLHNRHHVKLLAKLKAELDEARKYAEELHFESEQMLQKLNAENDDLSKERDAAIKSHCGTCDGSGVVDSGGVTPWDAPVDMACPECKAKRNAMVVQGLEIAAKIFQYHRHRLRGVSADAFAICADMRDAIAAEIAKRKEPA